MLLHSALLFLNEGRISMASLCRGVHINIVVYNLFPKIIMSDGKIPYVKPHKMPEYEFQQSKYDVAPRIPFSQLLLHPVALEKQYYYRI